MTHLVKAVVISLFVAVIIGVVCYRSCAAGRHLDVDPNARREIEKAKRK